jgi:hypothetical protein
LLDGGFVEPAVDATDMAVLIDKDKVFGMEKSVCIVSVTLM